MQFDTEIKSAHFQQDTHSWILTDTLGRSYTSRYLVTAVGILSKATLPAITGIETFKNEAFHPSRWPEACNLKDKRVGVIGTGVSAVSTILPYIIFNIFTRTIQATGIQIIQEISKREVGLESLTVFQRTPNWSAPLRNEAITPAEMDTIREQYPEIFRKCNSSFSGFIHKSDQRKTLEVPLDEVSLNFSHY